MAKKIALSTGKNFESIGAAKDHFDEVLAGKETGEAFSGNDLKDIEAVYLAYCDATNWHLPSQPQSFYPTNARGPGYTTRCFGVTYKDGSKDTFSMPKALSAVAKARV